MNLHLLSVAQSWGCCTARRGHNISGGLRNWRQSATIEEHVRGFLPRDESQMLSMVDSIIGLCWFTYYICGIEKCHHIFHSNTTYAQMCPRWGRDAYHNPLSHTIGKRKMLLVLGTQQFYEHIATTLCAILSSRVLPSHDDTNHSLLASCKATRTASVHYPAHAPNCTSTRNATMAWP